MIVNDETYESIIFMKEKYKVSGDKFLSFGRIIYSKKDVVIYKLD